MLNTDYLEVFVNEDRLTTRLPVKIQRGGSIVTANKGADYDNVSQSVQMYGDVHGVIEPSNNLKR